MSQGCTSALLRRRRARTGGEETFEGGAGEEGPGRTTHPCSLPCSLLVFLTHAAASAGSLKTAVFDPCSMCLQQRKPSGCQKKGERRRRREWPVGPPGGHFFRPCPPQSPSAVAVSQRLYCAS